MYKVWITRSAPTYRYEKPIPNKTELLIKVVATSVSASDCIIRSFNVPFKFWIPMGKVIGFRKPKNPILGIIFAGQVDSIGEDVKNLRLGIRYTDLIVSVLVAMPATNV